MKDDEHELLGAFDLVSAGIAFLDRKGRLLHCNDAFRRMGTQKRGRFKPPAAVAAFLELVLSGLPKGPVAGTTVLRETVIRRRGQTLLLKAALLPIRLLGHSEVLLLTAEPTGVVPLSLAEIRSRWGLTDQQARVARLLGEGLTNDDIARELSISPYTARRHTEQVLAKLDVRSRVQVAPRLVSTASRARAKGT